jgi:hypothetical protein
MLSAGLGAMRVAAADPGYPPPPGAYRSESQIPQPAPLPAEQGPAHSVDTATQASRGSAGLLPLPADSFSASDTADILFGSVPTLPPSSAESNEHATIGGIPSSPGDAHTTAPEAPSAVGDGFSMDFSRDRQPPLYPDQGIPSAQHYPSHVPAYPGQQQPAPSYYQGYPAYPGRPERHSAGYPQSGGYEAPYRMSDPYLMPAKPDYAPKAAQYAPGDAMEEHPAWTGSPDLPGEPPAGALEPTGTEIFRPAE